MRSSSRWPRVAAAVFGCGWFLAMGGGPTLNPFNVQWLLDGDPMQHWFGFMFFQHSPWRVPLGNLSELLYPVGTNIAFTDSNPLLAIALKPFAAVLPVEYQPTGIWFALCFALQGYVGAVLAGVVTADARQQALGGMLFVLSAPLVGRLAHDTLCAHWLILATLYLGFRETPDDAAQRTVWLVGAIIAMAAGTHPYLGAMCWLLGLSVLVRLWLAGKLSGFRAATAGTLVTASMIAVFGAIGYFGTVEYGMGGFGMFSADLLTLVNPEGFSRLFTAMPGHPGQYEGAAYLGLGGMLAVLAGTILLLKRRPKPREVAWPVVVAAVLMGVFALSKLISYRGQIVLNLEALYAPFAALVRPFRSSGRFIWPLYYVVVLFGVWGVTQVFGHRRRTLATVLSAAVIVVQATDLKMDYRAFVAKGLTEPADFEGASTAAFRHLALFPMEVAAECKPFNPQRTYRYMWLAERRKLTFNSGRFARLSPEKVQAACAELERSVDEHSLDAETIYVLSSSQHLDRFGRAGATCGSIGGDWICVSQNSDAEFRRLVGNHK